MGDWWAGARQGALDIYRAERRAALALLRERRKGGKTTHEFYLELAAKLVGFGRLAVARRLAEALMEEQPAFHPAYYILANIMLRQVGPDAALEFMRTNPVVRHDPRAYYQRMGRLLHEAGRHQELWDEFEAVDLPDDEHLRWLQFMALLLLDAKARLQTYCKEWLARSPNALTPAAALAGLRALDADISAWRGGQPGLLKPHICQSWEKTDIPGDVRGVMLSWTAHHPQVDYTVFEDASARLSRHSPRKRHRADLRRLPSPCNEGGLF